VPVAHQNVENTAGSASATTLGLPTAPLLLLSDLLQQLLREAKMADIDLGGSKALIRLYYRLVAHPT